MTQYVDVVVVGAGASGLMCAIEASKRGRSVVVLDKTNKPGKKILMSGGGRCNFTNTETSPEQFISHNPHFCKSALSRYTPWDFIQLVEQYQIPYYEKKLGQLFCVDKSSRIVDMLLSECKKYQTSIQLNQVIESIKQIEHQFIIECQSLRYRCQSLVIATGGLSIPTLGSSPFGYQVATQFGLQVYPTRAALVPLTLHTEDKEKFESLSGISLHCVVQYNQIEFKENVLFTHRGLSGPAILQISSYWTPGDDILIRALHDIDLYQELLKAQPIQGEVTCKTILSYFVPKRVLDAFYDKDILTKSIKQYHPNELNRIANKLQHWVIKPNGTEGYRTAEVTLGGVDCDEISSKTFESKKVRGLYFIGEILDVTGWLGGYNFQWAWSSGWAAGQAV